MRSLRAQILSQWIADRDIQDLGDNEVGAVLDAIALVMYADFEIHKSEEAEFESLVLALPYGGGSEARDKRLEAARVKASAVADAGQLEACARDVARNLHGGVFEKVFSMLVTMTVADRQIDDDEEVVLGAFADAFGLDEARTRVIIAQTLDALGMEAE